MRLVTFLWRDPGDTRNVVVYSGHTNTLYGFSNEDLAANIAWDSTVQWSPYAALTGRSLRDCPRCRDGHMCVIDRVDGLGPDGRPPDSS